LKHSRSVAAIFLEAEKGIVMESNMKILIGYDGSEQADAAIDDLRRAGMPREADAMVVSVAESWFVAQLNSRRARADHSIGPAGTAARAELVDPFEEAQLMATRASERILSYFSEWHVLTEVVSGSPAREVLRKAMEWEPDLIVVGAKGRSAAPGSLLGSVSQKIVNEAACSVRVARGVPWKESSPVRMIVGLDGHPMSALAVEAVAKRPWPAQSQARIVTVVDSMAQLPPDVRPSAQPAESGYDPMTGLAFVDAALKRLSEAELITSSKVEDGDPKQVLVADADEWGADCIFLGSACPEAGMATRLLGSVSAAVVTRAHCSVEVVRCAPKGS